MSTISNVEETLARAGNKEQEYDWTGAAEDYEKASEMVSESDFSRLGNLHELWGYALHRGAMQADSKDEFRDRMQRAIERYEIASASYTELGDDISQGRNRRCDAMVLQLSSWLTKDPREKKRLVDAAWNAAKEAMGLFRRAGDGIEFGKTYNQLAMSAGLSHFFDWTREGREKIVREAVERGEEGDKLLSQADNVVRAGVCTRIAGFLNLGALLVKEWQSTQKDRDYWERAKRISAEAAFVDASNIITHMIFWYSLRGSDATDEVQENLSRALEFASKTKDKFALGSLTDLLAEYTSWTALGFEDPDQFAEFLKRALRNAEEARRLYSPLSFVSPHSSVLWVEAPEVDFNWSLTYFGEIDRERKVRLLEEAAEAGPRLIEAAEDSGYPDTAEYGHNIFSKVLFSLAVLRTDADEKKRLLHLALEHRKAGIDLGELIEPHNYWSVGIMRNYLAEIQSELASLEESTESKRTLLMEAVHEKEIALRLMKKEVEGPSAPRGGIYRRLGECEFEYGNLLGHLFETSWEREQLERATEAYEDAVELYRKANMTNRMAECYWKAAQTCDRLGDHLEAARKFLDASSNYSKAMERFPRLEAFCKEHANYMTAWSNIEQAKHFHKRQEYGAAAEFYEKASNLHSLTRKWSVLGPNYAAWASVERAEDLSRREESEQSIHTFEEAGELFREAKKSLLTKLGKNESAEEDRMVAELIQGSDLRMEYCKARIAIEEAKVLDREGDHPSSAEKYGRAAETLERLAGLIESESVKREMQLIAVLARAWQLMNRAEARASPELYQEASRLFESAKDLSPTEAMSALTLGHSRFCRGLEAGTRFADTGDPTLHTAAVQYLESAAKHYVKAGFEHASGYAEATGLLFDGYAHMNAAKRQEDPEDKAKLYRIAEKVLQASANTFLKAGYPIKNEHVLRLLEKVKKQRELALSLSEIFHTPPDLSTTSSFATPTPTRERPVGLETFEYANVQPSVLVGRRDLRLGESLEVEIEMVNAGRGAAQLIKVEEVLPQGFEFAGKPEPYHLEDTSLDMKGKRLNPLKTEEVRLALKPRAQGRFILRPRILYMDGSGKYKSNEAEPVEVIVKGADVPESLRGIVETRVTLPGELQFETDRSRQIFQFLVTEFVEDFMSKRLYGEKAGWRSLMDLVRELDLPRSALYGPGGAKGPGLDELERRGLVETRIFPEERGRGGSVTRVRITYENPIVKRLVEQSVLRNP